MTITGGVVTAKIYGHTWQRARAAAVSQPQQASPLAARPYELRHGGITLALNAGVPNRLQATAGAWLGYEAATQPGARVKLAAQMGSRGPS